MTVTRYHHLVPSILLYVLFYTISFTCARDRIAHQEQIDLDYIGKPIISAEDMEIAISRAIEADAAADVAASQDRVKRQKTKADDKKPTPTTTNPPTTTTTTIASTLPSTISTIVTTTGTGTGTTDEIDNTTIPSSFPSSSPSPSSISPSMSPTEISSSSTTEQTTSSEPPTTEEPPPQIIPGEGHTQKSYFCLCDYEVKVCDMNCCCDPDCTPEDKTLFTSCTDSLIYDPLNKRNKDHSCLKSYVMYRDNTPYHIDRKDNSLFCVSKENVKQAQEFSRADMDRISHRISHGKISTQPKYTWDSLQADHSKGAITDMGNEPYKYGSAIWYIRAENKDADEMSSDNEAMFRLPAPFHTDTCSMLEPVKYLQNSVSRCVRPLHDPISQCKTLPELNVHHFIKSHFIIRNPAKMEDNSTHIEVGEIIIPTLQCLHSMSNCKNLTATTDDKSDEQVGSLEFATPEWNWSGLSSKKCTNVLSQLNLTFVHEGLEGITKVIARTLLVDVHPDQKEIVQEFNTNFIWNNNAGKEADGESDKNVTTVEDVLYERNLPRSGNPGYIEGKPLILGKKVVMKDPSKNETADKKTQVVERMHVLPDETQWLRIQGAGNCPLTHETLRDSPRHAIIFGYDHVSTCKLRLEHFSHCEDLQRHIALVIFGLTLTEGKENVEHFTLSPFHVAAYGSPDAFPADWVPLTLTKGSYRFPSALFTTGSNFVSGGCEAITTAIHITVSYAYVGPVDAPQAKITGMFYEPEEPIVLPPAADTTKDNQIKNIPITTTVSFLDVTGKPTTRVATFPVVSVQLPADFFYPFSSSSSRPSSGAKKSARPDYFVSSSLTFLMIFFSYFHYLVINL